MLLQTSGLHYVVRQVMGVYGVSETFGTLIRFTVQHIM
jgi:hypothetical protein